MPCLFVYFIKQDNFHKERGMCYRVKNINRGYLSTISVSLAYFLPLFACHSENCAFNVNPLTLFVAESSKKEEKITRKLKTPMECFILIGCFVFLNGKIIFV